MKAWVLDEVGRPIRSAEVAEPQLRPGGVLLDVLSAYVPSYTREVADGTRGYVLPTPLVLGAGCVGRVTAVADDVFGVAPGDVVLNTALLAPGDADDTEILVGWTGVRGAQGAAVDRSARMQQVWRDGAFAQRALCPKESLIRLDGAASFGDPARLAFLGWLSIAAEGLGRAGQEAGQVVVVSGATGQLGGAAVLLALARGAARVVAVGRNPASLERLAKLDPRVVPVAVTGARATDGPAIAAAAGDGAHVVLDVLGDVPTAEPTLACFDSLLPGATMVLVGGVLHELPLPYLRIMRRRLTVRGSYMFEPATAAAVWRMVRSGTVDLPAVGVHEVGLADPAAATDLAARTSGLDFVALVP